MNNTTTHNALVNALNALEIECGEFILEPETECEHGTNANAVQRLRHKVEIVAALVESMSTPLDIAPRRYPNMPTADFVQLVRDGKVRVNTPDGDTARVTLCRIVGGIAHLDWIYEVTQHGEYEHIVGRVSLIMGTHLQWRVGDAFRISGEVFHIID